MPPAINRQPPRIVPVAGPTDKLPASSDVGVWCNVEIQAVALGAPRPEELVFRLDTGSTHTVVCERSLVIAGIPLPPLTGRVKEMRTSAGPVRYRERQRLRFRAWWHPDFAGDPFLWSAIVQPDPRDGDPPPPRLGLNAYIGCRWLFDSAPHALSGYGTVALDDIR